MRKEMGQVSVIVPVYNVESYLAQAIESLLHQKGCDLEIILVDDGSTDRSGEIAQQYAEKYSNVKCIHQKNAGLSIARNTGLHVAHGDYLLFLDSDDFFREDSIFPLVKKMKEENLDILMFSAQKWNEDNFETVAFGPNITLECNSGPEIYMQLRNTKNYYTCVWLMLVKKSLLDKNKISFVEGILHEDHLFTFQAMLCANRVACIQDPIYFYRTRSNSIMTSEGRRAERFKGFCITYVTMLDMFLKGEVDVESKQMRECVQEHIREISEYAAKHLLRMSKREREEYGTYVDLFYNTVKKAGWSMKPYMHILLYLACIRKREREN